MDNGHMYDYDHLHRTVLLEHKCNFRLALIYSKSFLSTVLSVKSVEPCKATCHTVSGDSYALLSHLANLIVFLILLILHIILPFNF